MSWGSAAATELAGSVVVERRGEDFITETKPSVSEIAGLRAQLVCPGQAVSAEIGALRGRGIVEREDGKLVATTTGVVEQVNKLIYVRPLNHRYAGSIGDVVVGRIVEVQTDRWAVELGTAQRATLNLGAIQLPGNIQRRRTDEDTLRMREFFAENDILSAEVQKVHESTGELSLQTRNARYGKLENGVLVQVPSIYIRRQAQHIVTLPDIGVNVVLGNNGLIWVCAPPKMGGSGSGRNESLNFSQMDVRYEKVGEEFRSKICRVRNSILFLAAHGLEVTPDSICLVYEQSVNRGLAVWELLDAGRCESAGLVEHIIDRCLAIGE